MNRPGWLPKSIHLPPSAKQDAFLIPALFLLNLFFFASWLKLINLAAAPWLIFIWLFAVLMLVPLAWRNRAPVAVFGIEWVLSVAGWPVMPWYTPVAGVPLALYAVAVHRPKRTSVLALLASFIPIGLGASVAFRVNDDLAHQLMSFVPNAIFLVIATVGAWGAGRVTQASKQHVQELERERETVREAVTAERSRIARELHDIVSHAVTAIVLQAAGASRVAEKNFGQVRQSLAHIESTGKQAMAELRRLLGVLEASAAGSRGGIDELAPQPGLADLPPLLTSLRETGMPVTVHVEGTPRNLDPSIDLAAYRIMQEGLTNVLKHAGVNSYPHLRLVWEENRLVIQIDNDLNPAAANRGQALSVGRGLAGLRARAQAVGGRLQAGPHHNGGYRLTATLPLPHTAHGTVPDATSARTASDDLGYQRGSSGGDQGRVSA
jgi:signal transduction histidine kinase